ncbi:MAG: uroporphyrinogen-III synthase [Chloroflexota bacterium]
MSVIARPRALVARPAGRADELASALRGHGLDPVHVPAIEILPAAPDGDLDYALARVEPAQLVILTSANAARSTLDACARIDLDPLMLRWAAIGEETVDALLELGIEDFFVPSVANAEILAAELRLDRRDAVLLPRADIGDSVLPGVLRARGVRVTEAVAYETHEAPESSRELLAGAFADGRIEIVVLTSASSARGLVALAQDPGVRTRLLALPVIASGRTTAATAIEEGFATVVISPAPDAASLAESAATSLGLTPLPGDPR